MSAPSWPSLAELPVRTAVVDVQHGRLLGLRKRAQPAPVGRYRWGTRPGDRHRGRRAGRDRLMVPFRDAETLGEELASYGPRVKVVSPPELATAVRRRLAAAAEFAARHPSRTWPSRRPAAPSGRANGPPRTSSSGCCSWSRSWSTTRACTSARSPPRFGITRKELEEDLRILICSGLPEGYPDDLLDIQWDDDHVFITQDLDLNRPVRFTVEEACALLTGLETLNGLPELAEGGALESVTLKLLAAAGEEGLKAAVALRTGGRARATPPSSRPRHGKPSAPAPSCGCATSRRSATPCPSVMWTRCGSIRWTTRGTSRRTATPRRACGTSGWTGSRTCIPTAGRCPGRRGRGRFPGETLHPERRRHAGGRGTRTPGHGLADDYYAERTAALPGGGMLAEIRFGSTDWLPMFVAQHGGQCGSCSPVDSPDAARDWLAAALAQYEDSPGAR